MTDAVTEAAEMLEEVENLPVTHAPTMGALQKVNYTHLDMIDYMLCNPACSLNDLALRYGYTAGWISNVRASDAWKAAFAKRRAEVTDDVIEENIKERMEGITMVSLEHRKEQLEAPVVADNVVLKAVELGAKGMGLGGNAPVTQLPAADHLEFLSKRLVALQKKVRTEIIEGEVIVEEGEKL